MSNPSITIKPNRTSLTVEARETTIAPMEQQQPAIVVGSAETTIVRVSSQGIAGPPGRDGNGTLIKVDFSFGDASPAVITTLPAGTTILTTAIVVQTPFNGLGAALQLGDTRQSDRLLSVTQNNPSYAAEYEANPGYTYSSATPILLTITPGAGCTQGAGFVLLEV